MSRLLFLSLGLAISVGATEAPPNILLITADNLGYGDLQCYRAESSIPTPNLNRLASEGARLTSFYTASPTCTVSRACLLTGRIPERHGLTKQLPGIEGNWGVGLRHEEILIPQLLKRAPTPYATGCFGKWNIGFAEGSRPTERGFDEFFGFASGNINYYTHNYNGKPDLYDGIRPVVRTGEYATDLFADAAIDFIARKSATGTPWFCYLPFNAPHFPNRRNRPEGEPNEWQAPDRAFEAIGLSPDESDPEKRYRAVIWAMDEAIGRVLAGLDKAGEEDRTFVFFMSDNGAFLLGREGLDVGNNDPLRSGGVTCWEGGLRVAAMARWPGKIKQGSVIEAPLWSPDLLQAAVRIGGGTLPDGEPVYDGQDPIPVLTEATRESPHRSFFFQYGKHAALRMGDWKIVREKPDQSWMLFHLAKDLQEETDLAAERRDQLRELEEEFARWKERF
jgi:arylsulfatase A-like enzyme